MKIFSIAAIALISLASCKKKYYCDCQVQYSYDTGSGMAVETWHDDGAAYSKKMYKKTAQSSCDAEKASIQKTFINVLTDNGNYPMEPTDILSTTCTLK